MLILKLLYAIAVTRVIRCWVVVCVTSNDPAKKRRESFVKCFLSQSRLRRAFTCRALNTVAFKPSLGGEKTPRELYDRNPKAASALKLSKTFRCCTALLLLYVSRLPALFTAGWLFVWQTTTQRRRGGERVCVLYQSRTSRVDFVPGLKQLPPQAQPGGRRLYYSVGQPSAVSTLRTHF